MSKNIKAFIKKIELNEIYIEIDNKMMKYILDHNNFYTPYYEISKYYNFGNRYNNVLNKEETIIEHIYYDINTKRISILNEFFDTFIKNNKIYIDYEKYIYNNKYYLKYDLGCYDNLTYNKIVIKKNNNEYDGKNHI